MLVWREDKDTRKVIRVPGELLFGEEAEDVVSLIRVIVGIVRVGKNEYIIEERYNVEKDGFVV